MFRPESQLAGRKTVAGRNLSDCGREPGLVIRPGTAPAKKLRAHAEAEKRTHGAQRGVGEGRRKENG